MPQDSPISATRPDAKEARPEAGARLRLRSFSRSLPMSLLRARESVMRHFRPSLRFYGMTEQQWRILRALTAVESIETMELAEATCLLAPSLSRILRDLEERGLVERRSDAKDLRRSLITISEEGRRLINVAGVHSEEIYAEITARFGPQRMKLLYDLLQDLEAELSQLAVRTPDQGDDPVNMTGAGRRGRPKKQADS